MIDVSHDAINNDEGAMMIRIDHIYLDEDGAVFFTPDGIGKIYFDTVAQARQETGIEGPLHMFHDEETA